MYDRWHFAPCPALVLLVAASTACGCAGRGGAVEPRHERTAIAQSLNAYILTDLVSRRLVVEVDWVAGSPPAPAALERLESVLARSCPESKRLRVVIDDEIPQAEWRGSPQRQGLERLVAARLDHDPAAWREEEVLYVLYVPASEPWYGKAYSGMTDLVTFERDDEVATVRVLLLFTEKIRDDALLWVRPARVERAVLIHELGHALGLVSNPEHTRKDHPDHCTRSRCVMAQPDLASSLVNAAPALFAGDVPDDFGELCRKDIDSARRIWSALADEDPDFAERLREARRARDAETAAAWSAGDGQNERNLP